MAGDAGRGFGIVPTLIAALVAAGLGAGGYHWYITSAPSPGPATAASATRTPVAAAKPEPAAATTTTAAPAPTPGPPSPPPEPKLSETEALRRKVVSAYGGDKVVARRSMTAAFVSEGRDGKAFAKGRIWWRAPAARAMEIEIPTAAAGGTPIRHRIVFDGTRASLPGGRAAAPEMIELMRLESAFFEPAEWNGLYRTVELGGERAVGAEPGLVVIKTTTGGMRLIDYYAPKTFLHIGRDTAEYDPLSKKYRTMLIRYSDHKPVDGVPVAHSIATLDEANTLLGVMRLSGVAWDVAIPDGAFNIP